MTPTPLSNGLPSTLGSYHDTCKVLGLNKAVAYFEEKIQLQGRDEPVLAHETQMMNLIATLELGR